MRRPLLSAALALAGAVTVLGSPALAAPAPSPSAAPSASTSPSASPGMLPVVPGAEVPVPDVEGAQAEVTDLGAEVARTTAELTEGTLRLEEARGRLAQTQQRAAQARTEADLALARAAEARAVLGRVVNAAYRTPRPDAMSRVLAARPDRLQEVVLADAELAHVQGTQNDALDRATDEGDRATRLVGEAEALQADAAVQAADVETQVAQLARQAEETRVRLEAAAERLRAVQVAAEQLAQATAAQQALIDLSGGLALCTTATTEGFPNGFLPPEALCPLTIGGGHRLRADAAAAFNALTTERPLCVTDSYRSYGAQVDVYARKPGLAAVPGTSNHGLGLAVDLCGGVETLGTEAHEWMKANAPRFGWVHPAWAQPGGSRPEPWHWEFVGVPAPLPAER